VFFGTRDRVKPCQDDTSTMMTTLWKRLLVVPAALLLIGAAGAYQQLPAIGASALLHPSRHVASAPEPDRCEEATFDGAGVALKGWRCAATKGPVVGTIVYLHGIADNHGSAVGVIRRYQSHGFDVIAYDSRAHGTSEGTACTYGFYEKLDLSKVIDTAARGPIILIGTSLGAAVALQEAVDDRRVTAVVAAESFSDLRTVATERAPFYFTRPMIDRAFALAESQAHFRVDAVSPVRAAAQLTIPVLLIHGASDTETPPDHSQRIFDALRGPKKLMLVPNAAHNQSLGGADVWAQIDRWVFVSAAGRAVEGTRTSAPPSR
jgi:alpha-beta hydrolase superfamily lysophospholipase